MTPARRVTWRAQGFPVRDGLRGTPISEVSICTGLRNLFTQARPG